MGEGGGLRGRVLVIDGGGGRSGRRFPPRPARPAPGLSAILASIAPQVLLAADGVDTVHLPATVDAAGVRSHLQASARHPGPLLVHVGGHLVRDRRSGALDLDLEASRLPWRVLAEELRLRPPQTGTLVIGDLSADPSALPQLRVLPSPLGAGLPLWAVVNPDPQQVGVFTRALVEALHGGRPGAGARLTPEQLQQQVHTVLRPDTQIVISHGPGWPVFRNTSRRLGATPAERPEAAPMAPAAAPVVVEMPPFDMPPLPPHAPTVHLAGPAAAERPSEPSARELDPYRAAIGSIVAAADAGEHARAVTEAIALEGSAVARHGLDAEPALKLRQVRAHVTRLAGLQRDAALLYRDVALSLLDGRGADDPETRQAAANAEACWRAIEDDAEARMLGPALLRLRQAVPDRGRLSSVERHLSRLRGEEADVVR